MTIYNSNGIKLEYSEVLANLPITESCEHVEELMKADHIVLSWRDSEKYTLPVGAYITYKGVNYALLEPYEPEQKSGDEFEYTPNFQHPKMYLGKVPFRFPTTDTEGNSITLLEWPYSGDIDTLLTFFCRTMESELGLTANTFNYSILGEIDMVVSTTFNAVDILSALSNIANQLKCEWHIDWDYKVLYFGHIELSRDEVDETVLEVGVNVGTPSVRSSKEGFYNTYEPQGSTRNISKRAASGEYVQGDVRLALNEEDYPDKVIYTNESGTVIASLPQGVKKYVKPLIFDNIYPKLDLYVYDVRCRERYLLDDNGEKIIDHYDGSTPVYKRYAVWYMRLAYPTKVDGHVTAWTDYTINPETDIISGKNLGGAFQPNTYSGAESFPLAGRGNADDGGYGFELNYHTTAETIPANPNDGDTGVIIKAGDYEIVFQQQNDYILPTTASQGIIPKGVKVNGQEVTDLNGLTNLDDGQKGNIVDLYNIVIGSAYTESAQDELANETLKYITNQFKDNNSYTLKSDVVAFKKRIDQDELLHTDSSLYIGEKVIYKNGDYELETRVMKLVTKLDYAFVQEITVGNEVLKGSTTTLKEQVQTILSGGGGNGSGGVDSGAVRKIVQAYTNPRFLSKIEDDTAQGFITMLKGLQIGANFEAGILGEGGVLRMNNDGKVELVVDTIYARMRAYFDSVVVREYKHESGNRIVSPAQGFNASRVEYIKVVNNEETIVENASDADYFRCYWRVDDGEKKSENQFVIGDLAFCEHSDIINGSLVTKRYWRVVRGRNAGNITTEDGEAWIDLSNAHDANGAPVMTTISWVGQGGVQQSLSVKSFESSTNGIPEAHDDICMLGCAVDTTRQGAIIEYVSGTNAPAYQIYQGIGSDATNPYVLTNKNQITLGYNSQTGKAEMKVYGDAYIGARDRSTYIEYKQDDGTQQHNPSLDIKAKIQTLPNSTYEGKTASQFVQDNQIKYGTEILALQLKTQDLQNQIDGAIESYFMTGVPSLTTPPVMNSGGSTYAEPWLTGSETQEERIAILNKHIGDLYYDKATNHGYRFMYDSDNSVYVWTILTDEDVTEALRMAAEAQETADGKSTTFLNNTSDSDTTKRYPKNYKKGDTWILQVDATIGSTAYKAGDILTASADSETYNASHWSKQVRYTDDTAFNGYIDAFLNGSSQSGDSFTAAAIQKAITSALGSALGSATLIDGGLMLTSLIGMRQLNDGGDPSQISDYTTWAGISGHYDDWSGNTHAKGHGIAAWYGGDMVDKEMLTQPQIDAGWGTGEGQYRWAKSVDRFDGSGYRADGNITWDEQGRVSIKDVTTIISSNNTDVLNELITFNNAFHFNLSQGTSTVLSIEPQAAFTNLYIRNTTNPNAPYHVATEDWVDDHYVTKTFFRQLFRAFKPNATAGQADVEVEPNTIDATISNIKAMVGFWTEQYVSALGQGSDGGGGGASVLYGLNDVTPNATGDGVMGAQDGYVLTYNGSTNHWYAAATAETYVLPQATSAALGGIKIGYSGTTAKTYAVALDTNGKAYVNVPWTDNDTWIAWVGATSTADGTAGYMPAPTSAQRTKYLRGDGTWQSLNNYSLPLAASGVRGGVQIGYTTDDANRNYAVQLSSEKMYVNVPWENTTYESKSEANGGTAVSLVTTGEKYSWNHKTYTTAIAADSGTNQLSLAANTKYKLTAGGTEFIFTTPVDTNTWRNIFNDGTEQLNTGTNTKGLNFTADGKTTITFLAAGTGSGQSGNANYATIKISSTWRGIQNNLTSDSTTDSLSAAQGKALKGSITTLEGYFTNGVANKAEQLNTTRTIWGQNFNGTANVSGNMTGVGNITMSANDGTYIKIGDIYIGYDSTNSAIEIYKLDENDAHVAANLYAHGAISALGQGVDGGGGGQGDVTWELLQTQATDDRYIHLSYISAALESYLTTNNYVQSSDISDMATKTWVGNQGYLTQQSLSSYYTKSEVDALARLTNVAYSSDGILAFTHQDGSTTYADFTHNHEFLELTDRPTTIAGYGIEDAKIVNGVITLGTNTITPLTSHQSVTNNNISVTWDTETTIATIGSTAIKIKIPANPDTNTWRNIFKDGTEQLATGINTKGLNFVGDGKTTITFLAAGTGDGQSGNANYATLKIGSTWRGIQDNLTSDSTTDSLSAAQGKALKGSITTLEGYFNNGVANDAAKLNGQSADYYATADDLSTVQGYFDANGNANAALKLTTVSKTAWGQTYWTANGVPTTISGNMTNVGDISFSASGKKIGNFLYFDTTNTRLGVNTSSPSYRLHVNGTFYASGNSSIGGTFGVTGATTLTGLLTANGGIAIASSKTLKIGDIYLAYDSTNNAIEVYKLDGTNHVAANLYARGGIAALGETSDGGGGGGQGDVTWALLASDQDTRQIAISHLNGVSGVLDILTGYTTSGKNYAIQKDASGHLFVNVPWSYSVFTDSANGLVPMASSGNKTTAETAVGNYYLCADGKFRQLPANAFKNDNTKNTAGTTNNASKKLFLVGALEQSANPQTYSNVNVYIGTDNCLYSNGTKVLTAHQSLADLMGSTAIGSATQPVYWTGSAWANTTYTLGKSVPADAVFTDHYAWSDITGKPLTLTKNTTGFSISGGTTSKTLTVSESYTLGAACAKGVTDNSSATAVTSSDTNLITGRTLYYAGYVKSSGVTSITLKAGSGISLDTDNTAITSTGTRTITNSGVRATTINGSYLRVNTNGTNKDLTIPYASSAGAVAWSNVSSKPSLFERLDWWTDGNGNNVDNLTTGTTFAYTSHNAPTNGTIAAFSCNNGGYPLQIQGQYSGENLYFRNYNGDNGTWNTWRSIIHSGNIGSQSVADSDKCDGLHVHSGTNNEANKIVRTDSYGYMQCGWINTTSGGFNGAITGIDRIYCSEDSYIRYLSPSNFISALSLLTTAGGTITTSANSASTSSWALKIVQGTDNGAGQYDSLVISANDVPAIRISDADGTQLGLSGGDYHGTITSTHDLRFFVGSTANSSIYSGAGGTNVMTINASGTITATGTITVSNSAPAVSVSNGTYGTSLHVSSANNRGIYDDAGAWLIAYGEGLDYGKAFVGGLAKGGYYGLNIGGSNSCMTIMDNGDGSKGLFQDNWNWIIYANTNSGYVTLGGWQSYGGNVNASGNFVASGGVSALSDARHKQVVRDTNLSVEQIANMPSVIFKWNDGRDDEGKLHAGTLAQNWKQVLPEVVLEAPDKEHTLSLSYGVAALVAAITTARKVVDHEQRIKALEKENKELREEISRLKIA